MLTGKQVVCMCGYNIKWMRKSRSLFSMPLFGTPSRSRCGLSGEPSKRVRRAEISRSDRPAAPLAPACSPVGTTSATVEGFETPPHGVQLCLLFSAVSDVAARCMQLSPGAGPFRPRPWPPGGTAQASVSHGKEETILLSQA